MDKAKKSLFNHIGLKILSLIVAVFMWVVIMNADDSPFDILNGG